MKTSDEFSGHTLRSRVKAPQLPVRPVHGRFALAKPPWFPSTLRQGAPVMTDPSAPPSPPKSPPRCTRYTRPARHHRRQDHRHRPQGPRALVLAWMLDNQCIVHRSHVLLRAVHSRKRVRRPTGRAQRVHGGLLRSWTSRPSSAPDALATELVVQRALAVREDWHNAAGSAMDADGRVYDPHFTTYILLSLPPHPLASQP